jgi:hypothetical protein
MAMSCSAIFARFGVSVPPPPGPPGPLGPYGQQPVPPGGSLPARPAAAGCHRAVRASAGAAGAVRATAGGTGRLPTASRPTVEAEAEAGVAGGADPDPGHRGGRIFAVVQFASSPGLVSVGDCFAISEFSEQTDPEKVDCTDPLANVKLAVKLDSATATCPEGDYDELYMTGAGDNKLCLTLNVAKGDCVANVFSDTAGYKKVTCADPAAEIEILDVVEGDTNVQYAPVPTRDSSTPSRRPVCASEPPRVVRRLRLLGGWGHGKSVAELSA